MKIIFLDIDGVINLDIDWCKASINVLNEIIELSGAKIVISSDWKYYHTIDEIRNIFKNQNVVGEIIGITENLEYRNTMTLEKDRATEINAYLDKNKPENYVVIDDLDLSDVLIDATRFVQTHFYIGLKEKGLKEKCLMILNDQGG